MAPAPKLVSNRAPTVVIPALHPEQFCSIPSLFLNPARENTECDVCVCVCVFRVEERVGRQLAVIGDEVDAQYAGVFNKMIDSLSFDETTPYDHFAVVARQLVLLTLFTFGLFVCFSVSMNTRVKLKSNCSVVTIVTLTVYILCQNFSEGKARHKVLPFDRLYATAFRCWSETLCITSTLQ